MSPGRGGMIGGGLGTLVLVLLVAWFFGVDPAPLLHACALLRVEPAQAVMIGDSLNDVEAAQAASMPVLVVPYGYNEGRPASTLAADAHVDDLLQAAQRIRVL